MQQTNDSQDQGQGFDHVFELAASMINALPLILLRLALSLMVGIVEILIRAIKRIVTEEDGND